MAKSHRMTRLCRRTLAALILNLRGKKINFGGVSRIIWPSLLALPEYFCTTNQDSSAIFVFDIYNSFIFFLLHYITKFKIPKFKTRKLMIPSNITWNMIPIYLPKLICEAAENLFVHPLPLREILAYYWDFPALHRIDWD